MAEAACVWQTAREPQPLTLCSFVKFKDRLACCVKKAWDADGAVFLYLVKSRRSVPHTDERFERSYILVKIPEIELYALSAASFSAARTSGQFLVPNIVIFMIFTPTL